MAKLTGKENANKIQAVINTLKLLEMPSTYDNVSNMLGIYNTLIDVRDDLAAPEEAPAVPEEAPAVPTAEEETNDGGNN